MLEVFQKTPSTYEGAREFLKKNSLKTPQLDAILSEISNLHAGVRSKIIELSQVVSANITLPPAPETFGESTPLDQASIRAGHEAWKNKRLEELKIEADSYNFPFDLKLSYQSRSHQPVIEVFIHNTLAKRITLPQSKHPKHHLEGFPFDSDFEDYVKILLKQEAQKRLSVDPIQLLATPSEALILLRSTQFGGDHYDSITTAILIKQGFSQADADQILQYQKMYHIPTTIQDGKILLFHVSHTHLFKIFLLHKTPSAYLQGQLDASPAIKALVGALQGVLQPGEVFTDTQITDLLNAARKKKPLPEKFTSVSEALQWAKNG